MTDFICLTLLIFSLSAFVTWLTWDGVDLIGDKNERKRKDKGQKDNSVSVEDGNNKGRTQ